MTNIERKFIEFIEKHVLTFLIIIVSIIALVIRINFLNFESSDYVYCLKVWFDYLKANNGIFGLKSYLGDYNAPYMTILALLTYIPVKSLYSIKFISILFDFVLAIVSSKLVKEVTKGKEKFLEILTYIIVLFLPSVIMNSSVWGQCDSIYAAFTLLSLLFLLKKRYLLSFVMLGISFSFKLQFIFILPLFIVLYFRKKEFPIFYFLIIPIINFFMCLPAMIVGKPILDCFKIYFNQTQEYKYSLVLNFNNFYNLMPGNPDMFYNFGILFTLTICIVVLFYCMYKKIEFNNEKILLLGLWFLIIVTYFLPNIHERYLYVGEILSIILYIIYKKHLKIALFINISAVINYSIYLFGSQNNYMWLLSLVYLILIVEFTIETFKILNKKENKLTYN